MRSMTSLSFLTSSLLLALLFVLGSSREAHAQGQSDLVIATNAEITFPSCTDQITYHYFFTVVDDDPNAGTLSAPAITNLGYTFTEPAKIDSYDVGTFNFATYEMAVTVPSPALGQTVSDCFTITYEDESVNPCFDVIKADREVCSIQSIPACVHSLNGAIRIVAADVACRPSEVRVELGLATQNSALAASTLAPAPAPPRRRPK